MKNLLYLSLAFFCLFSCGNDDDSNSNETEIEEIVFSGRTAGCSTFHVDKLKSNTEQNIVLTINGDREALNLSTEVTIITLPNNDLNVEISEWTQSVNDYFCNDVVIEPSPDKTKNWLAQSGTVTITITEEDPDCIIGNICLYSIEINFENVIFADTESNEQKIINNLLIEEIGVGWLPG